MAVHLVGNCGGVLENLIAPKHVPLLYKRQYYFGVLAGIDWMNSNRQIYLCGSCGQTMAYWLKSCIRCRSKTVERFSDSAAPDFQKRFRQVHKMRDPVSPAFSSMLVALIICVSMAAGWFVMNYFHFWPAPRQVAAKPGQSAAAGKPGAVY